MLDLKAAPQSKMKRSRGAMRCVLFAIVLSFSILPAAHASDEDTITYRELIMKQLDAEAAALGLMISLQIPPDTLSLQTAAIANTAKTALKAFEPKVPGGGANPEVWSHWSDFSKRLQALADGTEAMAKEGNNLTAVTAAADQALHCKECHDLYRHKK